MSEAGDRLARSRLAIIEQAQGRRSERKRERDRSQAREDTGEADDGYEETGDGWLGHLRHALGTWWRYHPAHMGVEMATPLLAAYARRKPVQFLGIAAAVGAAIVVLRPWRLISATGIVVALLKSSQLSGLVMSAMSAADYRKDRRPYE